MSCELEKYKAGEHDLLDRMSVSDLQYLTLLGKKSTASTQSVGGGMNC